MPEVTPANRKQLDEAEESSLHRELSFGFTSYNRHDNPVFEKVIKPLLQDEQADLAYLNPQDQRFSRSPDLQPRRDSRQKTEEIPESSQKTQLVNGLSCWASVSSLSSEDSFFLEGYLHPERTRDREHMDTMAEEDEDKDENSDGVDDDADNVDEEGEDEDEYGEEDEDEEMNYTKLEDIPYPGDREFLKQAEFDYCIPSEVSTPTEREVTPSVSFHYAGIKQERSWGGDTEGEMSTEDTIQTAAAAAASSASVSVAPKEQRYKTRSGQVLASPQKKNRKSKGAQFANL